MESLYTKYRPQTFADVVGQTHVVTTLEHAVLEGRTSHAYLFCGPRGTGKTTMARLLAKALMCERGEGHLPDGTCEECRLIAAGSHPDVNELDAASRTGVDNVRDEIISRVSFAPVRAPYKMYIIDEVHMLTTAAFNALLKTLEEPPSHVVFVLCTTDPQKIPETILSRVQRFDFHAIGNADIQARLAYICEREGFGYDPEALELVVRHARGGMRDAISELEQLSVSGGGNITVDVARDVLGEVSASTLERMSMAMAKRDVPTLFAQVESLVEVGRDLLQFTRALAARLRDVYVVAAIGAKSGAITAPDDEIPAISKEAKAFGSVDRVARALSLLSDASTEMRVATNQRLVLEVALTKIARPQSELTVEALADRVATLERQVAALSVPGARRAATEPAAPMDSAPVARKRASSEGEQTSGKRVAATGARDDAEAKQPAPHADAQPRVASLQPPQPKRSQSRQTAQPAAASAEPALQHPEAPVRPAPTPQAQQHQPAPSPVPTQAAPAAQPARGGSPTLDRGELQRRWKQVVDGLLAQHPQHGSLLMNSTIESDDGHHLTVALPNGSGFAFRMLERADVRASVDPMVQQVFGARKAFFVEAGSVGRTARPMRRQAPEPVQQKAPVAAGQPQPPRTKADVASAPSMQQKPAVPSTQSQGGPVGAPQTVPSERSAAMPPVAPTPQKPSARRAGSTGDYTQQTAPTPTTETVPSSAPVPTAASTASAYPAPWELQPLDDDAVPYDDFDASPYEEDYLFGAPVAPVHNPAATPQQPDARRQEPVQQHQPPWEGIHPKVVPWQQPMASSEYDAPSRGQGVPTAKSALDSVPESKPESHADLAPLTMQPGQETKQQTEGWPEASTAPQASEVPGNVSGSKQEAPAAEPSAAETSSAPKPKRTRRAGGIPADIVTMMTEIFGEGVTYSSEPAQDDSEADALESDNSALDDTVSDDDFDSDEGYADEPVDDADYDEDED